jgi:MFS family permease
VESVSTQAQSAEPPAGTRSADGFARKSGGFAGGIARRELPHYPKPIARYFNLAVVILASVVLWYQYFVPPTVGQILIVKFHMSFRFFVFTFVVANFTGAIAAVAGQITDRIGRCWVVIGGLGLVALLQLLVMPSVSDKTEYAVAWAAIGFVEGIILVATPGGRVT